MHLAYIDDSRDSAISCFTAIVIRADDWMRIQDEVIGFRRHLKNTDGIHVTVELHASNFLAGRGHLGAVIPEARRAAIFNEVMDFIATREPINVLGACAPRALEDRLFERLVERLNVYASKQQPASHLMIISDEGKDYTGLVRKMRRFNYIPSKYGSWSNGEPSKNLPISRIVEDIVFRDSKKSSFIQMADFCAFALLRSESLTTRMSRIGIDRSFDRLRPVLVTKAFSKDPRKLGIIRAT